MKISVIVTSSIIHLKWRKKGKRKESIGRIKWRKNNLEKRKHKKEIKNMAWSEKEDWSLESDCEKGKRERKKKEREGLGANPYIIYKLAPNVV